MPRDRTPQFVLALAALLVALQVIGVMAPSVSGHAYSPSSTPMEWSTGVEVADHANEIATCGDVVQIVDPTSGPAGRDRHRPAAEPAPKHSVGGLRGYEFTAQPPEGLTSSQLASRSSATPSLASLQAFRC